MSRSFSLRDCGRSLSKRRQCARDFELRDPGIRTSGIMQAKTGRCQQQQNILMRWSCARSTPDPCPHRILPIRIDIELNANFIVMNVIEHHCIVAPNVIERRWHHRGKIVSNQRYASTAKHKYIYIEMVEVAMDRRHRLGLRSCALRCCWFFSVILWMVYMGICYYISAPCISVAQLKTGPWAHIGHIT